MTDLEQEVAELWREILEALEVPAGAITANSSFLDLGGDSLTAAEMRSRLCERYAVKLQVSELFDSTTVAQVAARIEQSQALNSYGGTSGRQIEEGER